MGDDSQSSFRELTVGGIFRESLVLYREMWTQLLRIVAPSAIISAIVYFFIFARQPDLTGTPSAPATAPATLSFVALVLFPLLSRNNAWNNYNIGAFLGRIGYHQSRISAIRRCVFSLYSGL